MLNIPALLSRPRFSAEAEALAARLTARPSLARVKAIDALFASLRPTVLSKLDVLHILAAGSQEDSLLNWKGTSFTASLVNSPTFVADRYIVGNGTSSYVDSGFNPSTAAGNFAQNSATFAVWSASDAQQTASAGGWFDGSSGTTVLTRNSSDAMTGRLNSASSVASANSSVTGGRGLRGVARSSSSAIELFAGATVLATPASTSVAPVNGTFRYGSATSSSFSAVRICAGIIGGYLDSTDKATLNSALTTYLTSIGAL